MTKEDIIKTAFKVWGRDLYRTTSLSQIARELGVSKPALYRHFKDKEALLGAMNSSFFDDCAGFIKTNYEKVVTGGAKNTILIMRTVSEYYIRNKDAFVFSLIKVAGHWDKDKIDTEFLSRGIDFRRLAGENSSAAEYPSKIQLVMVTLIFFVSQFHLYGYKPAEAPTEEQVKHAITQFEGWIMKGLRLDAKRVSSIDFQNLERQTAGSVPKDTEDNVLSKAVAGAVAEAGPWDASMEMVARRSGLSKSSLYAHFKNKQDMLEQLFFTEFNRIVDFAKLQMQSSEMPEAQLYLGIMSIVEYLRSRPDILMAMDWVKARPTELGKGLPGRLSGIIGNLKIKAIQGQEMNFLVWVAQWILFLIINTLAWWPPRQDRDSSCSEPGKAGLWAVSAVEVPNESFRILFRFIALGLEGLHT